MSQEIGIVPPPGRTCAEAVERYLATCARSDEIVRSSRPEGGVEGPVHVVEETGRHAGQADILRELIDGATHD